MHDLLLILPEVTRARSGSGIDPLPAGLRWRLAPPRPRASPWREVFAQAIGCPALGRCPVAAVLEAARAAACQESPQIDCWVATPVHWLPGLTQVHAPLDTVLRVSPQEAEDWAESFASIWGHDTGLRLLPAGAAGFLLHGVAAAQAECPEPADLRGRELRGALPQGAGAPRLQALRSEIEMWLHEHPLNRRRELRGEAGISSLWLWGGGDAARAGCTPAQLTRAAEASILGCMSEEPWVVAASVLLGVPIRALPAQVEELLARGGPSSTWVVVEDDWNLPRLQQTRVQPLCEALARGQLARLRIETRDHSVRLERADRWRWWRRAASPLAALGGCAVDSAAAGDGGRRGDAR